MFRIDYRKMSEDRKKQTPKGPASSKAKSNVPNSKDTMMATEWSPEGSTRCENCKIIIDEDDEALQCELCEFWFHTECQNINKSTYNFLVKNAKSREKNNCVHWYCKCCDSGAEKILKAVTKLSKRQDEAEKRLDKLENNTDNIQERLEKQEEKIKDLSTSKLAEKDNSTRGNQEEEKSKVVKEVTRNIQERMSRQKNIIIFRMPEIDSNLKTEITDYDERCVRDICKVTAGTEYVDFECRRLGSRKVNEERDQTSTETNQKFVPRPMMVNFREEKDKAKMMTNLYRLGNNDNIKWIKNISVKNDMTPQERERDKILRKEAKEKNEVNTEENFVYLVRGPPWQRVVTKVRKKKQSKNKGEGETPNLRPQEGQ